MFDASAEQSASFCMRHFQRYASFAHLPIYVTVMLNIRSADMRNWYYDTSDTSHKWTDDHKASMEKFINRLNFDDHDFFNIDDYQLFLAIDGPSRPLSSEQIEQDRQQLLAEIAKPVNMTKDHAKSMLKAVEFWKLRYDTKYQEWMDKVSRAWGCNVTAPNPVEVDVDEGYLSD